MPERNHDFSAFRRFLKDSELTRIDEYVPEYQQAKRNAEIKFDEGNSILPQAGSG